MKRIAILCGVGVLLAGWLPAATPDGPAPRFAFSGVVDSGEQSANTGEAATSVICSNFSSVTLLVTVEVTDFDGTPYEGLASIPPSNTTTFSTHRTALLFDDIVLGTANGTPALDQGSGIVYADSADVLCTAFVLDPANARPAYMARLPLTDLSGPPPSMLIFEDGFESGNTSAWSTTLP